MVMLSMMTSRMILPSAPLIFKYEFMMSVALAGPVNSVAARRVLDRERKDGGEP
jgi:hypothetical protein